MSVHSASGFSFSHTPSSILRVVLLAVAPSVRLALLFSLLSHIAAGSALIQVGDLSVGE